MKTIFSLVTITFIFLKTPIYCSIETFSKSEYEANEGYEKNKSFGYDSPKTTNSSIGMSMMGWGIGLATVIAIISAVYKPSIDNTTSKTTPTQ